MPIYEYQCTECGKIFEAFQKMTDAPLTECRFCMGKAEQLISQTSFQLKGGGWYVTDYAKKSGSTASAADEPKSAAAEKSSESKSDSAPKSPAESSSKSGSESKT